MILSDKQFSDQVKKKGSKVIYFFEGFKVEPESKYERPFETIEANSNAELLKELKDFSSKYPAKFTAYIHSTSNSIRTKGFLMKVDLAIKEVKEEKQAIPGQINEKDIEERIILRLRTEQEVKVTKKKLEIAENTLEKQKLMSEKLAMAFMSLMEQLTDKFFPEKISVMQGSTETESKMTIQEAVQFLREKIGDKNLITLAGKIKDKPELLETIKNFLL